ncbi:MAG TPA: cytochrome P450 [Devosiaceae bacterium]|jgi:cytochrome P450|nr:cytochrome P450 [Devosiaceae bacterium]
MLELVDPAAPSPPAGDDRKTAALAGWSPQPPYSRDSHGAAHIHGHELARGVLRGEVEQSGFGADIMRRVKSPLMRLPMLFMDGDEHQAQRRATARFFAPRAAEENYQALIIRETDRLLASLERSGEGRLDLMAMDMSVTVAAEIVGLTRHLFPGMAGRIARFLSNAPVGLPMSPKLVWRIVTSQTKLAIFFLVDVWPNIRQRRRTPGEDVISHLLSVGYKNSEILTECVLFGAAGMVTTREFITIAALHLMERPPLRDRFVAAGEPERRAILEEILRLEPVIGRLYRRATKPFDLPDGHHVDAGQEFVIDIRSANGDEQAVGRCPFHLDPDRAVDARVGAAAMGFGDGRHRCPGAFIALQESAIFLGRLLAMPGLRLVGTPDIRWNDLVGGYEFHECRIAVDRGAAA